MRAKDLVEVFTQYEYNGVIIGVGNKNEIEFNRKGTSSWINCKKDEVIQKLSYMKDNEELFGVPKYFILDCLRKTA